jgi:ribosomal protein S18 acetylase RimI-like enzyme
MPLPLPEPPPLPGHTWRPAQPADAPAIARLVAACGWHAAAFDGIAGAAAENTLLAADEHGELALLALVRHIDAIKHEQRIQLDGIVHPAQRGLGDFLLAWMTARGRQLAAALPAEPARVLRIEFAGARPEVAPLIERHGFALSHSEFVMQRDLAQPLPAAPLPAGVALVEYRPELAHTFYETYADAFWERSSGAPRPEVEWATAYLGTDGFRADCSLLAMDGERSAAYVCCGIDPPEQPGAAQTEGWIWQIGVRRADRRRGLASALLAEVMRRFQALGLATAVLDENLNNPTAKSAYEQLGFVVSEQFTVYGMAV